MKRKSNTLKVMDLHKVTQWTIETFAIGIQLDGEKLIKWEKQEQSTWVWWLCENSDSLNKNFLTLFFSRPYWRCYYSNTDAIIYVVDSSDRDRIGISKDELLTMLKVCW